MNNDLETLNTSGVTMMPYNATLRAQVERAATLWQKFCDLPIETKQLLQTNSDSAGSGYEFKNGIGNHADRKENFDIALSHIDYLQKLSIKDQTGQTFIQQATQLAQDLIPLANEFGELVENHYGIKGFSNTVRQSTDSIFVRFLHYFGNRSSGEIIAEPHVDQSGFTFHLFETDSGCQRLDLSTRTWQDMPVQSGKAAAFPAMQLQLASDSKIKALAHRVVATESTKDAGRFAIVCFVRLANTPVYDKDRHGRLQEMPAGFNYDMPHEQFVKLFTDAN